MILCDRPCSNKSEYGYCNTTYCINPAIPNTAVGNFPPPQTIQTNADRIRSMTDAELAEWFGMSERMCPDGFSETIDCDACPEVCTGHWLLWLKEEVKHE